jgi:alpha-L-fucosidase
MPVVPTANQVAYQEMEFLGFIHFTLNTWTDREWGYGDESPSLFDPTELDTDQWAEVAAEAGMKELILTTKHHDGFVLWPSAYTRHSVAASPWQGGEGDLVGDFVASARQNGLEVGFYISPWDRNHPEYGEAGYVGYYRNQLTELLTQYGPVREVWFDGANGGDGYYGGAREERRIDRFTYYDWPSLWGRVKELQPEALIFSDAGPDIRWIGNERGFAPETTWSTMDTEGIVPGVADSEYLGTGDPEGSAWVVPLCNTSIRPGWFYHADQDDQVKSPQELVVLYYRSVGRNCVLLLNVPPDRRGIFHENDVAALGEMRRILDETFAVNHAAVATPAESERPRGGDSRFAPERVLDGDLRTFWAVDDGVVPASVVLELPEAVELNRVLLQEPIHLGQRIAAFSVLARVVDGGWREVARGTTVGFKRLLRFETVQADAVQVIITEARGTPALSEVGLYTASAGEGELPESPNG